MKSKEKLEPPELCSLSTSLQEVQVVQVNKCKLLAMVQRENGLGSYIAIDRGGGLDPPFESKNLDLPQ